MPRMHRVDNSNFSIGMQAALAAKSNNEEMHIPVGQLFIVQDRHMCHLFPYLIPPAAPL